MNIDRRLIGTWASDPTDIDGLREFGRATVSFSEEGELTYTVHSPDKDQKMFLTFEAQDGVLITDQPSAPRKERSRYSISPDGKLHVWFGGQQSIYVRTEE